MAPYYLDFNSHSGHLAGAWDWTNASASVVTHSGSGGDATKLAAGDYVRVSNGTQWYKVATIVSDNSFTIAVVFQQASVITDGDGLSLWSDISAAGYGEAYDGVKSCVHVNWFTTDTARTAGDILYVRANQTHVISGIDITTDEAGSIDAYISIIGCDAVTNDPWSDASAVKPIFDFSDTAFQFAISKNLWWFERLSIKQSADGSGNLYFTGANCYMKSCDISDSGNSGTEGIYDSGNNNIYDSCTFTDCWSTSLLISSGFRCVKNCTFDAGVIHPTTIGLDGQTGIVMVEGCSFSPSNAFSTTELKVTTGRMYLRNCTFGVSNVVTAGNPASFVVSEDNDGTFEAQNSTYYFGTISRATASPRAGGADSYAVMTPVATCGLIQPLVLGTPERGFAAIWATKDIEINVAVYACVKTAWDSALGATEAYAKFSYLSNAATAARTEVPSTETISNVAETWTAFTSGNIIPLQTGWIYVWFYLAEYEDATEEVWVDIKPVVTVV